MKPRPEPRILELGEEFYVPVVPARFPKAVLRFFNSEWAQKIGLENVDLEKHFHRFEPLPQNLPEALALKYHGHQFRHYNPDLGDGRGFLFAQIEAQDSHSLQSRLYDLGTKGSGQTPFSRGGDGRLTLKGAYREALATEMLESLGVNTSKTFCFFETGEKLERNDEPSPTRSAVLTRLSHSHIRFGTFQRLAYFQEIDNIKKLVHYCLKYYYPELLPLEAAGSSEQAALFLKEVSRKSSSLTAQWMMAGFVHGVLNSDNMNITGESFDYGPYRFLPYYDPAFTAAYFDTIGLYAYGRQPQAVYWNLQQLGLALIKAYPDLPFREILSDFGDSFNEHAVELFLRRLNLKRSSGDNNEALLNNFFELLSQNKELGFEQSLFDFFGGKDRGGWKNSPQSYSGEAFENLVRTLDSFETADPGLLSHPYFQNQKPCTLLIDEIESIWQDIAQKDDWASFHQKLAQIRSFRGIYKLF